MMVTMLPFTRAVDDATVAKYSGTLIVPRSCYESMLLEAAARGRVETGGILIGTSCADGTAVVSHVVGPGPKAVHQRDGFIPDHDYHDRELARIYAESGRKVHYLGDWHTHPEGEPFLSPLDRHTLAFMAMSESIRVPRVFMLIWGDAAGEWEGRAWCADATRRRRLFARTPKAHSVIVEVT